jgi:hypothetical protein
MFFDVFLLGKAKKVAESILDNLYKPKDRATILSYSKMISAT